MANYAYLRVSTHTQDVENQKLSVLDYCNSQGIAPIEFVEDTTSGRRSWGLSRNGVKNYSKGPCVTILE